MKIRKKNVIDGTDKEILRILYQTRPATLSGSNLAGRVDLTPSAIAPRLRNLQTKGIIKPKKISAIRTFKRKFNGDTVKIIRAPRSILWGLNLRPTRRRKSK